MVNVTGRPSDLDERLGLVGRGHAQCRQRFPASLVRPHGVTPAVEAMVSRDQALIHVFRELIDRKGTFV